MSEKPGAPDVAICVAFSLIRSPASAGDPDEETRALEMRGGTITEARDGSSVVWCATLPSSELALGIWLAEKRVRGSNTASPPDKDAPVAGDRRVAALATEGAIVEGPPAPRFVIGVSGGVAAAGVVALAETAFGEKARYADNARSTLNVHQSTERLSVIEAPVPSPRARHGWIVGGDARERAALAVAAEVLASGSGSRLHRDLVLRRFIAHSVSPWTSKLSGGALFGVEFEISTRTSLDRARRFIDGSIRQLGLVGPSRGELRRARNGIQLRALLDWENPTERARNLSLHELAFGDGRVWLEEVGAVSSLKEETVRKAVHDDLVDARRTTVETYPPQWPADDPRLSRYRTYTVEAGDVLSDIASRFGVTIEAITRANDLDAKHRVTTGQALLIPP